MALLLMVAATPAWAAGIQLGAPFGDHMVVQRDRPIRVWGQAANGASVEVRLGTRTKSTKAA
ncbi:sialate O-acetylesterase, partial [Singulisphaera rosea]